jgi:hypothetical protein
MCGMTVSMTTTRVAYGQAKRALYWFYNWREVALCSDGEYILIENPKSRLLTDGRFGRPSQN